MLPDRAGVVCADQLLHGYVGVQAADAQEAGAGGGRRVSALDVQAFTVGPVRENAYIVRVGGGAGTGAIPGCRRRGPSKIGQRALMVDPGEEPQRLLDAVAALGVQIEAILITHCHFDHIGAVAPVARATGAPVYCPRMEVPLLKDIMTWTPPGFGPFEGWEPEHTVAGGERLSLAGLDIEVVFTPGHSPGHVTYAILPAESTGTAEPSAAQPSAALPAPASASVTSVAPEDDVVTSLLSGDVLFQGSVGRTDLPGGDWNLLERSIGTLLERFPGETTVYPGHMGVTTLEREQLMNPFLAGVRAEIHRELDPRPG